MAEGIVASKNLEASSPTSPSTFDTVDHEKSKGYDCEAAKDEVKLGTWRAQLGMEQSPTVQEVEDPITRKLDNCAQGYPRLAALLSSDNCWSIYRRFGYLHSRVLLGLQDQIAVLERELDQKDLLDQINGFTRRLKSRVRDERESRQDGEDRPRENILNDIRRRLGEYDELLVKARDLVSFHRPADRDQSSVRRWIGRNNPLVDKEQAFIHHKEDLLTLDNGREWGGFDRFVESSLHKLDGKFIRWAFLTPELRAKTDDEKIHYYSRSRVDKLIALIITSIIFVLLVLPVVAMYELTALHPGPQSTFRAVGVLVVFTLLFSAAMSLITKAQRHELFAASAAYCAVLVVFISNLGSVP